MAITVTRRRRHLAGAVVAAVATLLVAGGLSPATAATPMITWSTSLTQTQTVTVTERAVVNGFEGYGTATATATATATGTATYPTYWEVYYWATMQAYDKANTAAQAKADALARPVAYQRALADAQAQAAAAAATPPGTSPVSACGQKVLKADGTPWTCTFADDFRGSTLDTTKWSPIKTETSDFTYGDCFLGAGPNVTVADGALNLTTRREAAPVTCKGFNRTITTNYTSGAVTSFGTFSQTYGRVEIRAAMPASKGAGLQSALWMIPDQMAAYGAWPGSGEIDIAEFFSNYPNQVVPTLHYNSTTPFEQRTNNACYVYKPTDFHTYGLEWTKDRLKITVDGTTCLDHAISASAPLKPGAPFDRPFNINLTQMLGSGTNVPAAGVSVPTATLKVDYVHVWS